RSPESWVRNEPIHLMAFADALAGVGQTEEALKLARKLSLEAIKPINRSIGWQMQGEYLAAAERFEEAAIMLRKAEELLPVRDEVTDRVFVQKWLLYVEGREENADPFGRKIAAESLREIAGKVQRQTGRDEVWLLFYSLIGSL